MDKVATFFTSLLDILFPPHPCELICNKLSVVELEKLVGDNGSIYFRDCIAPLPFSHIHVKSAIHAMKYYNHQTAPWLLAQAIAPVVTEELAELRMFGYFHEGLLVPIPLHPLRFRERRFNQSERICNALQEALTDNAVTVSTKALYRKKNTAPQAKYTNREARIKNIHNAFEVKKTEPIKGKDIFLIDDVITTGTTLKEAKRTLLEAGARQVVCIAVAH